LILGQAKTVKCYLCSTKVNETGCLYPESYGMPLVHCDESALHQTTRMANEIRPVTYNKVFAVDTADLSRHLALDCLKVVTKGNFKILKQINNVLRKLFMLPVRKCLILCK